MDWKRFEGTDAEWDAFLASQRFSSFAQSSAWEGFQRALGRRLIRLVIPAQAGIQAACQLALVKKPIGSFWLAQRGPIFGEGVDASKLMEAFRLQAPKLLPGSPWFIRVEPVLYPSSSILHTSYLRRRAHDPSVTRMLDLSKSEDVLLSEMHQKTRYNIGVAEKHGVGVIDGDVETFLRLQNETAARQKIDAQADEYVRLQYDELSKRGLASIRVAQKDGEPLAANFMLAFGDTVTYLYGASSSRERNVMAPYALHWESIRRARQEGFRYYDFWGCNPESATHPDYKKSWVGISRFKAGWGGELVEFAGTYDLPLKKNLYNLAKIIGRL